MIPGTLEERVAELERWRIQVEKVLQGPATSAARVVKPETVREFLNLVGAKSAVDKALAISVWLERHGTKSITSEVLKSTFGQAKEPIPSNPADLLYQNGRRGFMSPSGEKKEGAQAWFVTHSGEQFVAKGMKD